MDEEHLAIAQRHHTTAYDFAAERTGDFAFGIDCKKTAAELRRLATLVEEHASEQIYSNPPFAVQSIEVKSTVSNDDFCMTTITIILAEKREL